MKPGLLGNRDVLAGLLFAAIGAAGFTVALAYPFGSVQQMGPGYFPRVLGVLLMGFGAVIFLRGLRRAEAVPGRWGWFALTVVTVSMVAFGWLMERVGLVPSLAVLVLVSAYAGPEFRWREALLLTVVLCLLAVAIFVWGLGLPYPLFAWEFGS